VKYIIAYTDGSCNVKTRFGGCGALLQFKDSSEIIDESYVSEGYSDTTISRMELLAIIRALQSITYKDKYTILVISDSQYTVNSINNGWIYEWEQEGFFERKNADLWKLFLEEFRRFEIGRIKFIHTRGHNKGKECYREGNNIADELADYKQFNSYTKDEEKKI